MPSLVLTCTLLCAFTGWTLCTCTPKNHTLWIEKHECDQCVAVNTTICSGYCYTQDTNLRGRFGRNFLVQRSCVPLSLVYRAARLPGCPRGVDPQLYYPAARRCSCRRCDTRTHRCVSTRRFSHERCTGSVKSRNQSYVET